MTASRIDSAPTDRTMASRTKSSTPASRSAGLNALGGGLVEQRQDRGRVVLGQGLEHRRAALVAGGAEQRMDDLDGQLRAAGGQQLFEQRLGVAHRAARAAGHDLERLGLGFDLLSRADLLQACRRSPRA